MVGLYIKIKFKITRLWTTGSEKSGKEEHNLVEHTTAEKSHSREQMKSNQ